MQGVIFTLDFLQFLGAQFVQRGQEEQMICFSVPVRLFKFRVRIMPVKFVGSQFYIDVMAADAKILEVAAGDVKTGLFLTAFHRRIYSDAGDDPVGLDHVGDVQVFDNRRGVAGVELMAFIETSSHFGIGGAEREKAIDLKVVDTVKAAPPARSQRGRSLGCDAVPRRTQHLSGNAEGGSMIAVTTMVVSAFLGHVSTPQLPGKFLGNEWAPALLNTYRYCIIFWVGGILHAPMVAGRSHEPRTKILELFLHLELETIPGYLSPMTVGRDTIDSNGVGPVAQVT